MRPPIVDPIVPLADLASDELALAGGKAANLGAMVQAGLPVPPGFCVTVGAYRAVVAGLALELHARLAGLDVEDGAALDAASAEIRARITALDVPDDLASAIQEAYARLPHVDGQPPAVAVRSSATAEDLPDASFAGQQDTYLNIGAAELLDAVRRCWASLWTSRAIAYRRRNGFADDSVALAVVVQQMVDADVSGVLFTADPVSGNRDRIVVNAAWGLGESIVGGIVAPDTWTLDASGSVLEQQLGDKQRMVVYSATGGTVVQDVPAELRKAASLTPAELARLAELGRAAAQHFGAPQDIEWALAAGRLYLLQSRPITTLFPLPEPRPADDALHVYLSFNAIQGIVEPITPLGIDMFRELGAVLQAVTGLPLKPPSEPSRITQAAGRIYLDAGAALRNPIGRELVQVPFRAMDPSTVTLLRRLREDPRLAPTPLNVPRTLRTLTRLIWRARRLIRKAARALRSPDAERRHALEIVNRHMQRVAAFAVRPMELRDRRAAVRSVAVSSLPAILPYIVPLVGPAMVMLLVSEALVRRWELPPELMLALRQGIPNNPTTEMDLKLWKLAQQIKADPASRTAFDARSNEQLAEAYLANTLPEAAQQGLAAFLLAYGHRAVREIDTGMPRWSEAPAYIVGAIRNYMLLDDPAAAPDKRFAELDRAAEEARSELLRLARAQPGGQLKAALLGFTTSRVRKLLGMREVPKFFLVKTLALCRAVLSGAGDELVRLGALDLPGDVFFLTLDELDSAAAGDTSALRALVAARRADYEREMRRRQPPRIVTSEGEALTAAMPSHTGDAMHGLGVSPGVYRGRVRVIHDPHGAQLEPGEILVAPSTDPAWTPLFLTAGGLVMDAGGTLSHGSVVAREYGIPAVVGVMTATDTLRTGQLVQIDGSTGTVTLVDE